MGTRTAKIHRYTRAARPTASEVAAYMPSNYKVIHEAPEAIYIAGEDRAGWTLDGYVIPRLQSGMIFAKEITSATHCGLGNPHRPHDQCPGTTLDEFAAEEEQNHEDDGAISYGPAADAEIRRGPETETETEFWSNQPGSPPADYRY